VLEDYRRNGVGAGEGERLARDNRKMWKRTGVYENRFRAILYQIGVTMEFSSSS
jgi:hypothetical protein